MGAERFATRGPARFAIAGERIDAAAALHAGAGEADFSYRADARGYAAGARFDRAELSVVSVLFGARLEGVMSGEATLESAGQGLRGRAALSVDNARLPARMRNPLDIAISADLEPTRLSGSLRARSPEGLDAEIEGSAPVVTAARPLRIAIAENGEGEARWRATGPADALWSLVGGLDQALTGDMSGQGQIRFNAQRLRGEGALTLSGGRFEDKRAGLSFSDVNASFAFTEEGESQFQLTARDEHGGRLSGLGAARGLRSGRMALRLEDLRFVERSDVTASASGDLALEWTPDGATLSGELTLNEAQLALAARPETIIPIIDVVEINRPDGDRAPQRPRPRGAVARLDLALRAPGRVYTRGRGLNAEWSLGAHLRGTTASPLLQGEARLIRGEFDLAGRPFEMTRGRIGFTGALEDTTIDLLAERVEPELTARAAMTGRLFDPTITFSSDPALPEDEIMPQILFGRSADDLSPLEAAQLAASLAALAGGAAFDIAGMARSAVGLDRFDVREDGEGVLVSGGRYLTRDVYFEVSRTGLGEPGAKVEWRARPQLSIVTSFQSSEDQRVSVRWRRDY
ncbi:MAG: translocation/assembly module TamB domain-containing protein [Hydrogenophilaceae bacterium]|nr:translocation/assembly module TamB domain-containing protein [Hydrogenophilaceae bacterium]